MDADELEFLLNSSLLDANRSLANVTNRTTDEDDNNWWALSALSLVIGTAAGNILVCLAICWERRLQNVTNYFLMSLAITDLMVAILVMPLGIYTLFRGYFALPKVYCLAWICLDVLFCTASIMHLCTISVDRYLSLRYPMKFGRNKSRRRVILKIAFVWLLSIAMSLPLSLMYSKDQGSLIIDGTCQIPDPLYKFIGSIICFYIPLLVMLVTYALTVRLLANQKQSLGTPDWSSNWMGGPTSTPLERRCTWRRLLNATKASNLGGVGGGGSKLSTPQHAHSAASTDTELTTLDTHELWIQDSEPRPCTMSALGQFGAEMLKLSRGLEAASNACNSEPDPIGGRRSPRGTFKLGSDDRSVESLADSHSSLLIPDSSLPWQSRRRRASTFHEGDSRDDSPSPRWRRRGASFHEARDRPRAALLSLDEDEASAAAAGGEASLPLPPPCTCPYFGERRPAERAAASASGGGAGSEAAPPPCSGKFNLDVERSGSQNVSPIKSSMATRGSRANSGNSSPNNVVVTWEPRRSHRRGSSFGTTKTSFINTSTSSTQRTPLLLRRSATLRHNDHGGGLVDRSKNPSSPCLLQRYAYGGGGGGTNVVRSVRSHHSRNSSVISRNSSRHGRIIRLEQKATKVLGVVFFTFVILWAPFFILNLLPTFCSECDKNTDHWVFDLVTWLGYASSMVNPIFYTIFNKVFRQAFKKVLTCKYRKTTWRPHR